MYKFIAAFTATAALLLPCAPASALQIVTIDAALHAGAQPHQSAPLLPAAPMSELPEPEVFAMMLLGLVLIGYRASRDSDEKFR